MWAIRFGFLKGAYYWPIITYNYAIVIWKKYIISMLLGNMIIN